MPQLQDLTVDWVSLVDRAAVRDPQNKSEPRRFLLWKREGADDPIEKGAAMTEAEMKAAVEKAEDEKKAAEEAATKAQEEQKAETAKREDAEAEVKKLEARKPKASVDDDGDIDKDETDESSTTKAEKAVEARIKKAEEEAEERVKKAEEQSAEATRIAKEERELRVKGEYIQKAEGFRALPVKAADFGPVLMRAAERLEKADYDEFERLLKAADEQLSRSDLFKEMGSSVGGSALLPDSAVAELNRKAEELQKSDSKLTKGQAEEQVLQGNIELQRRILAEG